MIINNYNLESIRSDDRFENSTKLYMYYNYVPKGVPYIPFSWHPEYEIIFCLSGNVEILLSTGTVVLSENDCFMINMNTLHATKSFEDTSLIILGIPSEFVNDHLENSDCLYFDLRLNTVDPVIIEALEELKTLIKEYKSVFDLPEEHKELLLNSIALKILFLLNKYFRDKQAKRIDSAKHRNQEKINTVIEYVYNHYNRDIPIAEISALIHYQPQYFCRFFKKNTGKTFLDFQNSVRMYYARQEILYSSKTLSQIAEKNGFKKYDSFQKIFFRTFGVTPREFRNSHK